LIHALLVYAVSQKHRVLGFALTIFPLLMMLKTTKVSHENFIITEQQAIKKL